MVYEIEPSIVRIRDRDEIFFGVGFLINEKAIITCEHVVEEFEKYKKKINGSAEYINLDFPLVAPDSLLSARVTHRFQNSDVAIMELVENPLEGVKPTVLKRAIDYWEHSCAIYGIPSQYNKGVWVRGIQLARQADGLVQIICDMSDYKISPGFSGSPVWDITLKAAVGMVSQADRDPNRNAAFFIPSDVIENVYHLPFDPVNESVNKTNLREAIVEAFNLSELRILCNEIQQALIENNISLRVDLEDIGGVTKEEKVLELIGYLERRGYFKYLLIELQKERPNLKW